MSQSSEEVDSYLQNNFKWKIVKATKLNNLNRMTRKNTKVLIRLYHIQWVVLYNSVLNQALYYKLINLKVVQNSNNWKDFQEN